MNYTIINFGYVYLFFLNLLIRRNNNNNNVGDLGSIRQYIPKSSD